MNGETRFGTRTVHAGQEPDPATGARAPPIYQTTSYCFEDADHAASLYALEAEGDVYSRISNPTTRVLETRLADLEGGVDAVATASGMAAFDVTTTVLAAAGDNVVSSAAIYGGTTAYLTHTARRRGVEARFVEPLDYDADADAIDGDTAFVHLETLSNPSLLTPDVQRVADVAHDRGVPLVVDNTFATPELCRPIEHGADVVWHSTTKWLHGHGTTLGGVVVDGGTFDWAAHAERYPEVQADPSVVEGWKQRGARVLINLSGLGGEWGREAQRTARSLLESGLADAANSDLHGPGGIEVVRVGLARLRELVGEAGSRALLVDNPAEICGTGVTETGA